MLPTLKTTYIGEYVPEIIEFRKLLPLYRLEMNALQIKYKVHVILKEKKCYKNYEILSQNSIYDKARSN
jgi:hypothetical protein